MGGEGLTTYSKRQPHGPTHGPPGCSLGYSKACLGFTSSPQQQGLLPSLYSVPEALFELYVVNSGSTRPPPSLPAV